MRRIVGVFVSIFAFALSTFWTSNGFGQAFVATKTWTSSSSQYTNTLQWTPNGVPTSTDSILFNSGSYSVTFPVGAGNTDITYSIANMQVASGGLPIFTASGAVGNVTLAASNDVNILGALTLGSSNPVNLTVGDLLTVANSATGTFLVTAGSDVTTDVLNLNNGTMTVNGSVGNASLTVGFLNSANTSASDFSTLIGNSSTAGTLNFQSSSTNNRINGSVLIGNTSSGTMNVASGSALTLNSDPSLPPNRGVHDLFVGTRGLTNVTGTLNINDTNSILTQLDGDAPSNITVGAATGGTGLISIAGSGSGGILTTGSGVLQINRTGTVNVSLSASGGGTLNANGDIVIDGGLLKKFGGGTLNWAPGRTTTLIHGGVETLDANFGAYNTPTASTYNIDGFGSALQQISTGAASLNINNGAHVNVTGGGSVSSAAILNMGTSGAGNLSVDGIGSSAVSSSGVSTFGAGGNVAQATFSNYSTGSFTGGLYLVGLNNTTGSTAVVTVESGAVLNVGNNFNINNQPVGVSGTTAILTVTGQGSAAKLANSTVMTIGTSNGTATVYLNDFGDLNNANGSTILNTTGTININGGSAELGNFTNSGGKINFISGSLSYTGALTIGTGGLLGSNFQLNAGSQVSISGTTTVSGNSNLGIEGGNFSTSSLVNSGNVSVDSGGMAVSGALTNQSTGAFIIGANRLATFNGASTNAGEIQLGGGVATLSGGGSLANTGLIHGTGIIVNALTNNSGGEIRGDSGQDLKLTGVNGTNLGKISLLGGTVEFSQSLTNGASTGQIVGHGTFITHGTGLTNNGNMAFSGGTSDVFGDLLNSTGSATQGITISGNSAVTFWDDVTNGAGSLFRVSSGSSATFFGSYSGAGVSGTGTVYYESDVSPGFSPALVNYGGNVVFDSTAKLKMELGGTTAGTQYDKIVVNSQLSLAGALNVVLINGFTPALGNSFNLFQWGSLSGQFDSVTLPALTSGLAWDSLQLYTLGKLSVVNISLLQGDFSRDGHVNAADVLAMEQALSDLPAYEQATGLSPADVLTIGNLNGDGQVNASDLQSLLTFLKNGGGSITTVPEPSTLALAGIAVAALAGISLRRRNRRLKAGAANLT